MSLSRSRPVWIFGAGSFGRAVAKALNDEGFDVTGFIQTQPSTEKIDGRTIHSWQDLPASVLQGQVVLGVFNRETPYDALVGLSAAAGVKHLHMPWEVYELVGHRLGWRYWLSAPSALRAMEPRWREVERRVADNVSRDTLRRIFQFRCGQDLPYSSFQHTDEQYFNELTLLNKEALSGAYVDCGAYDGDTYLRFLELAPQSRRAFLLEPDPDNFRRLVARTASLGTDAVCLPLALANQTRTLTFSDSSGEASSVDPQGTTSIQAVSLDELLANQKISFLKIDIEGAERAALIGARNKIIEDRPIIAMSLYHRPEDPCKLTEILFEYCERYAFFVRQHYFNSFESVFYAIPES